MIESIGAAGLPLDLRLQYLLCLRQLIVVFCPQFLCCPLIFHFHIRRQPYFMNGTSTGKQIFSCCQFDSSATGILKRIDRLYNSFTKTFDTSDNCRSAVL